MRLTSYPDVYNAEGTLGMRLKKHCILIPRSFKKEKSLVHTSNVCTCSVTLKLRVLA